MNVLIYIKISYREYNLKFMLIVISGTISLNGKAHGESESLIS